MKKPRVKIHAWARDQSKRTNIPAKDIQAQDLELARAKKARKSLK